MNLASKWIAAVCAVGALAGCSVSVEPIPGPPPAGVVLPAGEGSMTVNWLVSGQSHPRACAQSGAASVEIVVYDPDGRPIQHQTESCESFTSSITLPPGTYSADVTLLDAAGRPLSSTKTISAINVVPGTDLAINLDF